MALMMTSAVTYVARYCSLLSVLEESKQREKRKVVVATAIKNSNDFGFVLLFDVNTDTQYYSKSSANSLNSPWV
jgi:hypothetical protein